MLTMKLNNKCDNVIQCCTIKHTPRMQNKKKVHFVCQIDMKITCMYISFESCELLAESLYQKREVKT